MIIIKFNKKIIISIILVAVLVVSFLLFPSFTLASTPKVGLCIVIDPGHGGIDSGAIGIKTGNKESDLNLEISYLLGEKLQSTGIDVVYTRTTHDGLYGTPNSGFKRRDMLKRKEIVLNAKPDLVISVHMNKFAQSTRRGAQVYFQKLDEKSQKLAQSLQNTLNMTVNSPQINRNFEPQSGDFWMCKILSPAVIVECGFLSNPEDDLLLNTPSYRQDMAYYIFNGIMNYLLTETSFLPKN